MTAVVAAQPRRRIVVDAETTGLDDRRHVPVEIGWWDLATGAHRVFIPDHSDFDLALAEPDALRINGYHARGLGDQDRWDDGSLVAELHAVLTGNTLAGANPRFDTGFLNRLFVRCGLQPEPWHYRLVDVENVAMAVLDLNEPPGMSTVAELLGTPAPDHTARGDVLAEGRALMRLREIRAGLTERLAELTPVEQQRVRVIAAAGGADLRPLRSTSPDPSARAYALAGSRAMVRAGAPGAPHDIQFTGRVVRAWNCPTVAIEVEGEPHPRTWPLHQVTEVVVPPPAAQPADDPQEVDHA